jgi:hypothetical protein
MANDQRSWRVALKLKDHYINLCMAAANFSGNDGTPLIMRTCAPMIGSRTGCCESSRRAAYRTSIGT